MTMLYCIKHEEMEKVEFGGYDLAGQKHTGHLEDIKIDDYPYFEIDFCEFPDGWATCPPPKFDMDSWLVTAIEPDAEEMALINANAEMP